MKALLSVRVIVTFALVTCLGILFTYLQIPFGYILLTSTVIVIGVLIAPHFYMLLYESRVDRLEKFISSQKNRPQLMLIHAMGNRHIDKVNELFAKQIKQAALPEQKAMLQAAQGAYFKNWSQVTSALEEVASEQYQFYYQAFVLLSQGNWSAAEQMAEGIVTPWMKHRVLGEVFRTKGDTETGLAHAKKALAATRGVQYYVLAKHYEHEWPEALKDN